MKKIKLKFLIVLVFFSCTKNTLITNHGIEGLKLGQVISNDFEFDKNDIDITIDEEQKIRTIIISSEKYETKDGFGVGSDIYEIKDKLEESKINDNTSVSKGEIPIIDLGRTLIYENLIFLDENRDGLVDSVMIHQEDN